MLERVEAEDGLVAWRSPALAGLGVPHLFTTRRGPGGAALDAGRIDARAAARLAELAGAPGAEITGVRQVHGAAVAAVGDRGPDRAEADALVSDRPGVLARVLTADCVPVLLASAGGARVAAVHAGWRGLVAGVIPRALAALGAGDVTATVGPCLSLARFEVGGEVAAAFEAAGLGSAVHRGGGRRPHVDLRAAVTVQLERGGVPRVDVSDRCTWDDGELWSHRRDVTHGARDATGRLAALVGVRAR